MGLIEDSDSLKVNDWMVMQINTSLDIVILNWNSGVETVQCLQHLDTIATPDFRVILIDNGSSDGSVDILRAWAHADRSDRESRDQINIAGENYEIQYSPMITPARRNLLLVQSTTNLGFAMGCNLGIVISLQRPSTYILLLNNDAFPDAMALIEMKRIADTSGAGIVGGIVYHKETNALLYAGRQWPNRLYGRIPDSKELPLGDSIESGDVDGCAMLLRKDLLLRRIKEEGFCFDPAYFMYCEDVDLARYANSIGHPCLLASKAKIRHHTSMSSGGSGSPRTYYYITRNRIRLAHRWLTPVGRWGFNIYYVISRFLLVIHHLFLGRMLVAGAVVQGIWDGYLGNYGKWSKHDRPIARTGSTVVRGHV